jgi:hypothetical protein
MERDGLGERRSNSVYTRKARDIWVISDTHY